MSLNQLKPHPGSRKPATRVGRGGGSGHGKTAGRGHKGQKSRAGGFHKVGFEGGQMPIQRRLPKFGFSSRVGRRYAEVRLHELAAVEGGDVTPAALVAAGVVPRQTSTVKIILSGELGAAVRVSGCRVTKGARAAIEAAGGSIAAADAPAPNAAAEASEDEAAAGGGAEAGTGDAAGAAGTAADEAGADGNGADGDGSTTG